MEMSLVQVLQLVGVLISLVSAGYTIFGKRRDNLKALLETRIKFLQEDYENVRHSEAECQRERIEFKDEVAELRRENYELMKALTDLRVSLGVKGPGVLSERSTRSRERRNPSEGSGD
jgi:hypothetical protein